MKARSAKSFDVGFVLIESDLRRIVDISREQLRKLESEASISEDYTLTFYNGTIAEHLSLDEVLEQENLGSSGIVRLDASLSIGGGDDKASIDISFCDVDRIGSRVDAPVSFKAFSSSRDWTFVASSLIEERLRKFARPLKWMLT